MIAALGAYQEGVAKNVVNGKPVVSIRVLFLGSWCLVLVLGFVMLSYMKVQLVRIELINFWIWL